MLDILKDYGSFDKYPYFNLKDTYYLQFNFLPQLFELYEDAKKVFNKFDESKIIDIEFMKKKLNSDNINWENFKFEKKVLPDGLKEFIYDFGIPEKTPLCRYALFFTDDNNIHQYFTLEKKFPYYIAYPYIVCSQKGSQHYNYNRECPDDLAQFEKIGLEIMARNIKPIAGYNQDKGY